MRLTIVPDDTLVSIDGNPINGVDMSWIPLYETKSGIMTSVHAVQWYEDRGEVELKCNDPNIEITELGIFETAIVKYEERKLEIEQEMLKIQQQQESEDIDTDNMDIDALLAELESEENVNVGVATT
jgi:hypothetical protein